MKKQYPYVVIGAGASGLVVAIGLAKARKNVLLIERGNYGGDCTNFGCIPSKALISAAEHAYNIQYAQEVGLQLKDTTFNADQALEKVRNIVSRIRSSEDEIALQEYGVDTLTGVAQFIDSHTLKVIDTMNNQWEISSNKIIIATGSSPKVPPVEGLSDTPFLTNETIFDLEKIPKSLIIIGGGPIGSELAQAFNRLGSNVTIVHKYPNLLNKEPRVASNIVMETFQKEGIKLYLEFQPKRVSYSDQAFQLDIINGDHVESITGEHLLLSIGRTPNLKDLHLKNAVIETHEKGVVVDKYGRCTQKHIFAAGDVVGPPYFTHLAENRARAILTTLLLPFCFKKKIDSLQPVPRVTYTDPEVASVGLSKEEAIHRYGEKKIAIYQVSFAEIDRAIVQHKENGLIIIITKKWSSKILGATIIGARAGEMLGEILLSMHNNIPLRKLSSLIHPYPTYLQGIRKASDQWFTQTILSKLKKPKHEKGKR